MVLGFVGTTPMSSIQFPIFLRIEDEDGQIFDDEEELVTTVEYLNDWSEQYVARDASGGRMRLVLEDLKLLLAEPVANDWSHANLTVVELHKVDGDDVLAELNGTIVHRTFTLRSQTVSPRNWQETAHEVLGSYSNSSLKAVDFHATWTKYRLPSGLARWRKRVRRHSSE